MFASKLPQVGTTIFTVMSALAAKHGAINLGQGFPDFPMDEMLIAAVAEALQKGFNQYMPMIGYTPLLEAIALKVEQLYQVNIHPTEEITITPGGTYAIYTAITTLITPGDEAIVIEPAYDCYIPAITLNGGVPIKVPLTYPAYTIDWAAVEHAITPKTKLIVINSPHNPTGSVLMPSDIAALENIVTQHPQLYIISDEVYEHLVFDALPHLSLLRYPRLYQRAFVCFSFGKVYHCTGWKIGYCIAPPALTKEFRKIHQFNVFSVNSPLQVGIAKHLQQAAAYLQLGNQMQAKRDYFRTLMQHTPLQPIPSHGSNFELYSFKGVTDETEQELATRLVIDGGVATIPTSAFYEDGTSHQVLRFCFAKQQSTLEQAAQKLQKFKW